MLEENKELLGMLFIHIKNTKVRVKLNFINIKMLPL